MTTQQFQESLSNTFSDCLLLSKNKNADYANQDDPFKNFKNSLLVGVNIDRAILVRITDKLARISNLLDRGPVVRDEKLEDSINDAINYLAILKAYKQQQHENV